MDGGNGTKFISVISSKSTPYPTGCSKEYWLYKASFLASAPLATMVSGYEINDVLMSVRTTENVILSFSSDGINRDSNTEMYLWKDKDYILEVQDQYMDLTGDGIAGYAVFNFITKYDTYSTTTKIGIG